MTKLPRYNTLLLTITDRVAVITLNRPDHANGMDMELIQELAAVARFCDQEVANHNMGAVIITGEGKLFCAGGDINSFKTFGDQVSNEIARLAAHLHDAIATFMHMKAPVVTAINGAAAGAGFSLAMAGDLVIAAKSSSFMLAYTAIGLSPDGAATYMLPRIIGLRRAQELALLNRRLSADEALQWGLITKVVEDTSLLDEAQTLAKKLAHGPTKAFGTVKMLFNASGGNSPEQQMALEGESLAALSASVDGQEGILSFLEKRKPNFIGE